MAAEGFRMRLVRSAGEGKAAPGEMAVPYYLRNQGTGPAFNVEHGVEVTGKLQTCT
jgi:hypothetical protein